MSFFVSAVLYLSKGMQNGALLNDGCKIWEKSYLITWPCIQPFCISILGHLSCWCFRRGVQHISVVSLSCVFSLLCNHVWKVCETDHKCVLCMCVGVCVTQHTQLPVCWGVTPHSCCSSTNLAVTVPFIPLIGHGALWQSHVFAHWERQFLANFNRTVAYKKGRATCSGGGANPTLLFFTSSPVLSVVCAYGLVDVVFGCVVLLNALCHWCASFSYYTERLWMLFTVWLMLSVRYSELHPHSQGSLHLLWTIHSRRNPKTLFSNQLLWFHKKHWTRKYTEMGIVQKLELFIETSCSFQEPFKSIYQVLHT